MTKHTPGPWKLASWDALQIVSSDGKHVSLTYRQEPWSKKNPSAQPEAEANARLISAAADLLAYTQCEEDRYRMSGASYLEKWGFLAYGQTSDDRRADMRRAAIARATGQEK